ncbi:hypothetical protein [Maritimibacter fusiformis]|uniref:Uncharacterized protein n=1 Tax=Maritimibacter fusiformis TaxID=2603819 RepID=A0A5D0RPG8_9RHOB|nr:hypothetical protein [Maritimibacter fusiformis]TYB83480.1 hypothetical protein FVF75_00170 [Maritimibacter fusiformis]
MFNRAPKKITNPKAEMAQSALYIIGVVFGFAAFGALTSGEFLGILICGGISIGAIRWGASIKTTWEADGQVTRYR